VPGPGLRLSRAVLASEGGGELYVDTLKNNRPRTVPLVAELVPITDRWSAGKEPEGASPVARDANGAPPSKGVPRYVLGRADP
jgi:hypothetical protein